MRPQHRINPTEQASRAGYFPTILILSETSILSKYTAVDQVAHQAGQLAGTLAIHRDSAKPTVTYLTRRHGSGTFVAHDGRLSKPLPS